MVAGDSATGRPRKASPRADGVERALRDWLVQRRPRPGDRLPPDTELAGILGVARGTLRRALRRLEDSGDIVRRQGSGTFVLRDPAPDEGLETLFSYFEVLRRQGHQLTLLELDITRTDTLPGDVVEVMHLQPGERAMVVRRVLAVDGTPGVLMFDAVHPQVRLPPSADIRRRLGTGRMMLDILISAGVEVAYGRTTVGPCLLMPDTPEARALRLSTATAALELVETTHLASGLCVKHSRDVFTPGAIDLHVFRAVRASEAERPRPLAAAPAR